MIFQRLRVIDDPVPRSGLWNMAIDEALSETLRETTLRVYRWSEPTVSFGYFEKIAGILRKKPGVSLVRRWTGGGMVEHGNDFTYTLLVPVAEALANRSRAGSYREIHAAIQSVLAAKYGIAVDWSEGREATGEGCFLRPVPGDLVWNGKKVAGAAQRRTRRFLMHQGSIQNLSRHNWRAEDFAQGWSTDLHFSPLQEHEKRRAGELVESRYGRQSWLERF